MSEHAVGDRVATITIDRPERRNAMTFAMNQSFGEAMGEAGNDPAVHVSNRGLVPDTGAGSWLLPRRLGPQRAMELLFTGRASRSSLGAECGARRGPLRRAPSTKRPNHEQRPEQAILQPRVGSRCPA